MASTAWRGWWVSVIRAYHTTAGGCHPIRHHFTSIGTLEDTASAIEDLSQILRASLPRPAHGWHNRPSQNLVQDSVHDSITGALWSDCSPRLEPEVAAFEQLQIQVCPQLRSVGLKCGLPSGKFDRLAGKVGSSHIKTSHRDLKLYCEQGRLTDALHAVDFLDQRGVQLESIFYFLLEGCINKNDLATGREVYSCIIRKGLDSNAFLGCHLIRMFALCGSLLEANQIFRRLPDQSGFTWTAIISAHAKARWGKEAIRLYYQMQQSPVRPGDRVFVAVLKACSSIAALGPGKLIHSHVITSAYESDIYVGSTLIDMYAKCGSLEDAGKVFDNLPKRDVAVWSSMIAGYAENGDCQQALRLFQQMQEEGMEPDNVTSVCALKACSTLAAQDQGKVIYARLIEMGSRLNMFVGSTLIDMYLKCGNFEEACRVFAELPRRSVVTWSAMIAGYAQASNYELALKYFEDMQQEGMRPNDVTFVSLLSACSHIGLLSEGFYHFKSMWDDHGVAPACEHYNCMVDLLGRAGCLVEAEDLLQTMPFRPNAVGCMSLLGHCRTHVNVGVGKRCFDRVITMDQRQASGYFLMSEIYADAGMWDYVDMVKGQRKCARAWKMPGEAFIEIDRKVHGFIGGERSHPLDNHICAKLESLSMQLKVKGYVPDLDLVLHRMIEVDKEYVFC